jgi:hypothetical protein
MDPPAAERLKICGIASGFAFGYDPTGRSVFSIKIDRSTQSLDPEVLEGRLSTGRIPYFIPGVQIADL